jgi:hypothetical protein
MTFPAGKVYSEGFEAIDIVFSPTSARDCVQFLYGISACFACSAVKRLLGFAAPVLSQAERSPPTGETLRQNLR